MLFLSKQTLSVSMLLRYSHHQIFVFIGKKRCVRNAVGHPPVLKGSSPLEVSPRALHFTLSL